MFYYPFVSCRNFYAVVMKITLKMEVFVLFFLSMPQTGNVPDQDRMFK
jgi:hypothetical protein